MEASASRLMSVKPGFWIGDLLKMENSAYVKIKLFVEMTATGRDWAFSSNSIFPQNKIISR